jgi:hypothetical protein
LDCSNQIEDWAKPFAVGEKSFHAYFVPTYYAERYAHYCADDESGLKMPDTNFAQNLDQFFGFAPEHIKKLRSESDSGMWVVDRACFEYKQDRAPCMKVLSLSTRKIEDQVNGFDRLGYFICYR